MGEIIQLSDEESEEIDKALWEYSGYYILICFLSVRNIAGKGMRENC